MCGLQMPRSLYIPDECISRRIHSNKILIAHVLEHTGQLECMASGRPDPSRILAVRMPHPCAQTYFSKLPTALNQLLKIR